MKSSKYIERDGQEASKIFNNRSLDNDYQHLRSILKPGMRILDIGCGTGALSKDMAAAVGETGFVTGIDNTEKFIKSGKSSYGSIPNLQLIHADLFEFQSDLKFDLITSARTMQWLSDPQRALIKINGLLKVGGQISILDYNHEAIEWVPAPPESMKQFYATFLKWRSDAGMHNRIAEDLPSMLQVAGFSSIELLNSDEHYQQEREDFMAKVGIWSKVAGSTQMVEEGYIDDDLRLQAIEDYNRWVADKAVSMTMKLNEVRGIKQHELREIKAEDPLSQLVKRKGISSWEELVYYVRHLPYGRNTHRADFSLVLKEAKGTCSSKHAFLKKIAVENKLADVKLILCLYKMDQYNTPGIGNTLDQSPLEFIPEAHCYLNIAGEKIDATDPNASIDRIQNEVISEIEIEAEQVSAFKVRYHKDFIKKWIQETGINLAFDEIWALREKCIQNIAR